MKGNGMPEGTCTCEVCERSRKFQSIVDKLESAEDREFMNGIMEDLCSAEEDSDWNRKTLSDLRSQIENLLTTDSP